MHGASRVIKKLIIGILDFMLVLDACISIYSGNGTAFDYLVLVITMLVLLLAFAHCRTHRKHSDDHTMPPNDQQDGKH